MPLVAIAGGTSPGLGRSLTTAIIDAYPTGDWRPILLSRTSKTPSWATDLPPNSFEIRVVDYTSHASLLAGLDGCHTVLSVISTHDASQAPTHIALLQAAVEQGCTRFVPSDWDIGPAGTQKMEIHRVTKPAIWEACERSGISWSRFSSGLFMNYFGGGCDSARSAAALAGIHANGDLPGGSILISMQAATAYIPIQPDGTFPHATFTEMGDIGRFVAAALPLPSWPRDMDMVGATVRVDALVQIAERVADRKFAVTTQTRADLERLLDATPPEQRMARVWIKHKLIQLEGDDVPGAARLDPVVNRLCPEVRPVDVETYLRRFWT